MESLVQQIPMSEAMATLEMLQQFGVDRESLRKFRASGYSAKSQVADVIRNIPRWWRSNGLVRFDVTSGGWDRSRWMKYLRQHVAALSRDELDWLKGVELVPTKGVTRHIVLLPADCLPEGRWFLSNLQVEATRRGLSKPNLETSLLILRKFTADEISQIGDFSVIVKSAEDHRELCIRGGDHCDLLSFMIEGWRELAGQLTEDSVFAFVDPVATSS